ncbi:Mrx15p [Lachancea thermotolerans CBS 6340]|uniref:KLTH0A07172p n=1 Tax=Lachancea thermotolerans (strain ATCC 56472 / CBS 6340 / NRRL Y-8284) TaxID=559295 RepID=C5DC21_LACTC|nr:KLTH0A07172p [Lachancea thermotolerans CBS 6340]CAR21328.1 KLTH0A07172p [Lachancea thermotolerans CBS 6340]
MFRPAALRFVPRTTWRGAAHSTAGLPFSSKLAALIAKTSPEQIYTYSVPRLVKFGSWTLSGVFLVYGVSFADWSLTSSLELYGEEVQQPPSSWWKHPKLLLAARVAGSALLTLIPLTLSCVAIYAPSRIVTAVSYVPHGACKLTRGALLTGKPVSRVADLSHVARNQKAKVYTGVGPQGTDDRASFAFLLTDSHRPAWDRFYIVNRSGRFWAQDGRIFDALFGGESARSLECPSATQTTGPPPATSPVQRMIEVEQTRSKIHDHASRVKSIVMKPK